jgi:hypothetical protein
MRKRFFKKAAILLCALVFSLVSVFAVAAEKQWYVSKDKTGKCSVRQLKDKTASVIAGPFASKEAAKKAKEEKCPKASKSSEKPKAN